MNNYDSELTFKVCQIAETTTIDKLGHETLMYVLENRIFRKDSSFEEISKNLTILQSGFFPIVYLTNEERLIFENTLRIFEKSC